jgi:predicted transporter
MKHILIAVPMACICLAALVISCFGLITWLDDNTALSDVEAMRYVGIGVMLLCVFLGRLVYKNFKEPQND